MQTTLNLLTRNGVVFMAFKPSLSGEQYMRLLEISKLAEEEGQLRKAVKEWAESERLTLSFDE